MCGRYVLELKDIFHKRFGIPAQIMEFKAHYNIAPTMALPVVVNFGKERHLEIMRWGLIPHWAKDPKIGYKMINARIETVAEKPSFKGPLRTHRCIVPASGFYEWQKTKAGKLPYYIKPKDDDYFALAGLYDIWKDENDKEVRSYSILTGVANKLMIPIHERMPVILGQDMEESWLDPEVTEPNQLLAKIKTYSEQALIIHQVASAVNKVSNDSPDLIAEA
ncbi:SOS response-associated peptidase [Candidatus Margulisiibacteriota bacterium]